MELVSVRNILTPSKLHYWTEVFKGLGNKNRLKTLELLSVKGPMSVTELSHELEIALKNTSRNLRILANLDLVEYKGKQDRVFYSVNPTLKKEVQMILRIVF